MTKLEKVMEALDKAIRLSRKTGRPKPPKKIPRTYEGMDERESFATFKDWVLSSSAEELQSRIRRPLLPATNPQEER